jgi:hypothetical protein
MLNNACWRDAGVVGQGANVPEIYLGPPGRTTGKRLRFERTATAEDAVLVLRRQHVHLVHVQKIGGAAIRAEIPFADFEASARGIRMTAAGIVHSDHESVRAWQLFDQRIGQMRRERRDAAMARQVIAECGETPDVIGTHHAVSWLAVRVRFGHRRRSSSPIRCNAAPFNPWASRAMARSPSPSRPGMRRSSAAISSRRS